jgi:hypothetical protein
MNRPFKGRNIPSTPRSPEAERKAIEKRARKEAALERQRRILDAERAAPAARALKAHRSCGILALQGASIDKFLGGLEYFLAGEHVTKKLQAEGNTQGPSREVEEPNEVMALGIDIDNFIVEAGFKGIIMLEGAHFNRSAGLGTPDIASRISGLVSPELTGVPRKYPDIPSVLMAGSAEGVDLSAIGVFNQGVSEMGVAGQLQSYLMLYPSGELAPLMEHQARFS